jgi:CHAD domain-containing protein
MSSISLTDDQKQKIADLAASAPDLIIHRARLILAYATGKPTLQAAGEAGISRGRARYWKRQFIARGMSIFQLEAPASITGKGLPEVSGSELSELIHLVPLEAAHRSEFGVNMALPYPMPMKSIGINAVDTLADAGRKVWLFNFALMLCHEEGTLLAKESEELHDMRVATRRMRTAFDVFAPAFEQKMMKRFLKGLRAIGRALGEVRDMDVILEHGLSYQAKIDVDKQAGLEPLIIAWRDMLDKKRAKMARHLTSDAYRTFKEKFNLFLQAPKGVKSAVENRVMNPQLRDIVPMLIYGRYAAVRAYETVLPTASVAELHALRIEFKKFRYVLEYFREILGESIGITINEIKHIQDHLGVLHDTDVACGLVSDFLADWERDQLLRPIFERQNPEPIVTYLAFLHTERYRLTSNFPKLWEKFNRPEFRQGIAQAISRL